MTAEHQKDGSMSTMTASVTLLDGMAFEASGDSRNAITLDSPAEGGEGNRGPRPMELVLMALGGCTGMDVISILRKMRIEPSSYEVKLDAARADQHPKVFTHIRIEHVFRGTGIQVDSVERAVGLSATKYCPVSAMLSKATRVEHHFRVVDTASDKEETGWI
jgi:putative redox protein